MELDHVVGGGRGDDLRELELAADDQFLLIPPRQRTRRQIRVRRPHVEVLDDPFGAFANRVVVQQDAQGRDDRAAEGTPQRL